MAESRKTAGEYVANGMLDLNNEAMKEVADHMLRGAPKVIRFAAKRIPGAPGLLLKGVELATAEDKARAQFGMAGGAIGGLAGGALGTATGPAAVVSVPIAATAGSAVGEDLAEEFYDDHAAEIRRGIEETKAWVRQREADIARNAMRGFERYTRPPAARMY